MMNCSLLQSYRFHKSPRQNFSLQYLYNIKQTSDEIKVTEELYGRQKGEQLGSERVEGCIRQLVELYGFYLVALHQMNSLVVLFILPQSKYLSCPFSCT